MKEAVYDWMKCLAVFYILLSTMLHLVPTGQYERYVRFFMGLLLILMMCAPAAAILGKSREAAESFRLFYEMEENYREEQDLENLQKIYLEKGYGEVIGKKILENLQEKGIQAAEAEVHIEGERLEFTLWMNEMPDEELERGMKDALETEWGIREEDCEVRAAQDGQQTMGGSATSGAASGGSCPSGVG